MATVKVKMKEGRGGVDRSYDPGQIYEIDSDLALKWIENGWAEAIGEPELGQSERETASLDPRTETAVRQPGLPRKRKA